MGAGGNKHCRAERIRQQRLVSAKAQGCGGAMDKSGSSFGKVILQISFPWMLCGASDWLWDMIFLQAHLLFQGQVGPGAPGPSLPMDECQDTKP